MRNQIAILSEGAGCREGRTLSRWAQVILLACFIPAASAPRAQALPITLELAIAGGPTASMTYDGSPTLLPNGLIFLITVDTTTADTWAPTDFGLFPTVSVTLTAPDLGLSNALIDFGITPLAYFEDDSPFERAGIAPLTPSTGIEVTLTTPGNTHIGDPNVLDTISSMNMAGLSFVGATNSFTTVSGHTLSGGGTGFGAASLATIPEPGTALLLGFGIIGLALRRRFSFGA